MTNNISSLDNLSLLASTRDVVRRSNALTAELLVHLAEVESRGLYCDQAFPTMFAYCMGELGFSEDVTYNVTTVARLAKQFPELLAGLREGRLHLSGLRLLAPHFKEDNSEDLIARAWGKTKREIEGLVAHINPQPDVPDSIRKLPAPRAPEAPTQDAPVLDLFSTPAPALVLESALAPHAPACPPAAPISTPPPAGPPKRSDQVKPLAPNAYKVEFTATEALQEKLKEAQALLRHRRPDGSLAFLVEQAVDLLIAKVKKQRFGIGAKPRSPSAPKPARAKKKAKASTRHVPYGTRRLVVGHDTLRCSFVGPDGRRCSETAYLELDHRKGFARTGEHSADDMQLLCKAHNQLAAEKLYGRDFMKRKREAARSGTAAPLAPTRPEEGTTSRPGTADPLASESVSSEEGATARPGTAAPLASEPVRSEEGATARPGTAAPLASEPVLLGEGTTTADGLGRSEARTASRPGTADSLGRSEEGATAEPLGARAARSERDLLRFCELRAAR